MKSLALSAIEISTLAKTVKDFLGLPFLMTEKPKIDQSDAAAADLLFDRLIAARNALIHEKTGGWDYRQTQREDIACTFEVDAREVELLRRFASALASEDAAGGGRFLSGMMSDLRLDVLQRVMEKLREPKGSG